MVEGILLFSLFLSPIAYLVYDGLPDRVFRKLLLLKAVLDYLSRVLVDLSITLLSLLTIPFLSSA